MYSFMYTQSKKNLFFKILFAKIIQFQIVKFYFRKSIIKKLFVTDEFNMLEIISDLQLKVTNLDVQISFLHYQ